MLGIVIEKITSDSFYANQNLLSCFELRDIVYDTIVSYMPQESETGFEVSCWASRYARKYNRNKELLVLDALNNGGNLNYSYIKNTIIMQIIYSITGNSIYYEKITGNELCLMAESIFNFLKNMEIFEIQKTVLINLVKEYMTQKPHPWIVNCNRDELLNYHKEQAEKHVTALENNSQLIILQIESAYHLCTFFMTKYDEYIGCDEMSPIISLTNAVNWVYDEEKNKKNKLPMLKHRVIQLKKDLEEQSITFNSFSSVLNVLMENIVKRRNVTSNDTKKAVEQMWNFVMKLEHPIKMITENSKNISSVERVKNIFNSATGFVVKSLLRTLQSCFWVEPNWEKYESATYGLSKQLLVCVLDEIEDVGEIRSYIYFENRKIRSKELVFVKKNYDSFTKEEREYVRKIFNNTFVRCIFLQERDFQHISPTHNWRKNFL